MNILIADDHSIVITGLRISLTGAYPFCSIDTAKNGDEVFKLIKSKKYELAILDINMPGTDSTNLVQQVISMQPELKILIFSMYPEEFYARRFLKLGVKGYLSKESAKEEIATAIRTILDGKMYLSEKIIVKFSELVLNNSKESSFDVLSMRELEVARHLCKGMKLSEICELMNLHSSTVSTHKAKILEKLGVNNVIELRELAIMNNFAF